MSLESCDGLLTMLYLAPALYSQTGVRREESEAGVLIPQLLLLGCWGSVALLQWDNGSYQADPSMQFFF